MKLLGICRPDGYYDVGHAALLLVDYRSGKVLYFDFGRYHTPDGYGRVRDVQSDPELRVRTVADVVESKIDNLKEILLEIHGNKGTHGDGKLVCSIVPDIDYDMAVASAKSIQARGAVPYGPFQPFGTNCSRFVATIYRSSISSFFRRLKITNRYLYFHTPASNVIYTHRGDNVFVVHEGQMVQESQMMRVFNNKIGDNIVPSQATKYSPHATKKRPPTTAKKLTGIGGDTYFDISATGKKHIFLVCRYSAYGDKEIEDLYQLMSLGFDISKPFEIDYISNGLQLKVRQSGQCFLLKNTKHLRQPVPNRRLRLFKIMRNS